MYCFREICNFIELVYVVSGSVCNVIELVCVVSGSVCNVDELYGSGRSPVQHSSCSKSHSQAAVDGW